MGHTMWYRVTRYPQGLCPICKMMGPVKWDTKGVVSGHMIFTGLPWVDG